MKPFICATAAILAIGFVARAYYPIECRAEHAAMDYTAADAIVIARCVKVEQRVEQMKSIRCFYYVATLKVGRVVKGALKVDDEFEMEEGNYLSKTEDNVTPMYIAQCGTHWRAGLVPGGVFLLFIKVRGDRKTWSPVSCHYSIHEVVSIGEIGNEGLGIKESQGGGAMVELRAIERLDGFLKHKEIEAKKAAKQAAEVKPEATK